MVAGCAWCKDYIHCFHTSQVGLEFILLRILSCSGYKRFPYLIGRIGVRNSTIPIEIKFSCFHTSQVGLECSIKLFSTTVSGLFPYLIGRIGVGYDLNIDRQILKFPYLIGRIGVGELIKITGKVNEGFHTSQVGLELFLLEGENIVVHMFPYLIGRIGVSSIKRLRVLVGSFHTSQVGLEFLVLDIAILSLWIRFHTSQVGLESQICRYTAGIVVLFPYLIGRIGVHK